MKLKEYIKSLNALVEENPERLEFEVIYSADDEGNHYFPVIYEPTIGFHQGGEFYCPHELEDFDLSDEKPNSICIN